MNDKRVSIADLPMRQIPIAPVADLSEHFAASTPLLLTVGHSGEVLVITCSPPSKAAATQKVVAIWNNSAVSILDFPTEGWVFHFVQRLSQDRYLLVNARCRCRSKHDFDRNARIYGPNGDLLHEFLLGDGLASVQADADGRIWTSYFDEGVFGNYGWSDPIGACGLICWDCSGNRLYEYSPPPGIGAVCDCYALNVTSKRDAWLYYYTDFPLVHVRDFSLANVWLTPTTGAQVLTVFGDRVLFDGGYHARNEYHQYRLSQTTPMVPIGRYTLLDENADPLTGAIAQSRGSTLYLLKRMTLYALDTGTLPEQ